jgi:hypothetical protein
MSARGLVLALLVACGDDAARVRLVPISPCGQVTSETALRVVGYTAEREQRRTVPPNDIDSFPADTEQLGVEVIGDSGKLVAVGKTAPLAFNALADASEIPIVMAPLDGVCPVGPMSEPRRSPLLARAGDGVLVVGGTGAAGEPLATAELYDRATAAFVAVAVPATLMDPDNGLAGAVLTELADGRVALTGTSSHAIAIFDPATRTFSTPSLFDHRAFHGALAVDGGGLLVIGGCADVVAGLDALHPAAIAAEVDAAFAALEAKLQAIRPQLVAELQAFATQRAAALTAFDLRALAVRLGEVYGAVLARVDALDPQPLVASLQAIFDTVRQQVDDLDPAFLVDELTATFERVKGKVDGLDLATITARVDNLWRSVEEKAAALDPAAALRNSGLLDAFGELRDALGAISNAAVLDDLDEAFASLRTELDSELAKTHTAFSAMVNAIPAAAGGVSL